ncbi:E3 ubiquitin-protein ligase TRIM39-like [Austrofundulus limnaeus]|uniref:E3 ubiquitin-protein ligase TRIM39-like n=1 Tax=Austrofundulus limnaeus TaxID=52670 RepID=A0A2I4BNJ4_AUSLI|nr:PREDICTED: E3 ubiquitin-protein ligase TRIM39-like [Austrofundulus limnaeus]XP_013869300.1 PREDICTED: E3 ubiquitin-protein ligase TRIM39-like [Austrofundulus limnaeus]
MAATSCVLSEDQFLCCICLDVFTEPVTIPCGHNFCKTCITQNWNVSSPRYQCPMCKKQFESRPPLTVNTFISEMAGEFRQAAGRKGCRAAQPGEVPCDVCRGTKLKAVKSCLTCLASYCSIHLDPHRTCDRLKTHTLTDPVDNMEGRMCRRHNRVLELFCRSDRTCVCSLCMVTEHGAAGHDVVSLRDECEAKRPELRRMEAEVRARIMEKVQKSQQMKLLKRYSKEDTEREVANAIQVFTAVTQTAEKSLNALIEVLEERQKKAEDEANSHIRQLDAEISALTMRAAELQKLCSTQDHLHLIQNFPSRDWPVDTRTQVDVRPPSYEGIVEKAVSELQEVLRKEKEQLLNGARLRRAQDYAVDLALDPLTANPWLILSADRKQVQCGERMGVLPNNRERFSLYINVLAQQTFTSGRFYYEVQVMGKTNWIVGVVKASVDRKGTLPLSPATGYWALGLRNGNEYLTYLSPVVSLSLTSSVERVGVFVSYEERLVSFFDVDKAVHLYSFTSCFFEEKLCPFFSPGLHHGGTNSAPLIIQPVRHAR